MSEIPEDLLALYENAQQSSTHQKQHPELETKVHGGIVDQVIYLIERISTLEAALAEKEQREDALSQLLGRAEDDRNNAWAELVTLRTRAEQAEAALEKMSGPVTDRPKIVCLCGSTRFKEAFDDANYHETMAGNIVLSVGFYMHATGNRHGDGIGATPEQKIALDVLHKRKIDLADEVLVLNVDGYIGDSTRSEIEHAEKLGKPIRYLEAARAAKAKEKNHV